MSHLAEQHPRTRERHHCLLCERSFPTAERYKLHLSGRTHRHLELTQRRTIHTLFSVFTGHNCPVLTPLSESELAGLKWFPVEPGTIHFYHQATPLQRAVQDLLLRKERNCTNTSTKSNVRTQEDHPSKSGDSLWVVVCKCEIASKTICMRFYTKSELLRILRYLQMKCSFNKL